jgi:hypothetical protein
LIRHLLSLVPYKDVIRKRERPELPERQKRGKYVEPEYPYKYVPENY